MNRIITILLITTVFALSANFVFAQQPTPTPKVTANDDNDGDGVKNADDACPGDKGTAANKGCPGKDDDVEISREEAKKQREKLDSLKSNITFDPTPTPKSTPNPKTKPGEYKSPNQALKDCKFIIKDPGCKKFFGMSSAELDSSFGKRSDANSFTELGLFFYIWGDRSAGVNETVAEVTFYGEGSRSYKKFYGQPSEELNWNASREDVIKLYGAPTKEDSWSDSSNRKFISIKYGENYSLKFTDGKLDEITIRSERHNADVADYFVRLEEEKKRLDEAHRVRLAKQAEEDRKAQTNKTLEERLEDYWNKIKERDGIKTTGEQNDEEAKKLKAKLDSLESNIDIMATPKPQVVPATASTPKSTPPVVPITDTGANGTVSDCKIIISDGCRNYLMNSTIDKLKSELGLQGGSYNRIISLQVYERKGIELWVEPSSGRVKVAKIDRYVPDWKPAKDIKWGDNLSKIEKKYPNGKLSIRRNGDALIYPNYELHTAFMEGLKLVQFEQSNSESEQSAKKKRETVDDQIMLEKDRADTAYANSPAGIKAAFDSMHSQVESYANQANKKVEEFNKNELTYEVLEWRKRKEDEIYSIRKKAIDLINDFLSKNAGKLPQAMIDHLKQDLEKLSSGKAH